MRFLVLTVFLFACGTSDSTSTKAEASDPSEPTEPEITEEPEEPETTPEEPVVIEESIVLGAAELVDVLFVIDDSCSMFRNQQSLAASSATTLAPMLETVGDFHLGVVTTDMDAPDKSGKLQPVQSELWVDSATPELDLALENLFTPGTDGSGDERGLDAVYGAIETLGDTHNQGFLREGSALHVVVLADQDDVSMVSVPAFTTWFGELSQVHPIAQFHSVVNADRPVEFSGGQNKGKRYMEVSEDVGGWIIDLDDPVAFEAGLEDMAADLTEGRTHCPAMVPELGSVEIVDTDGTPLLDDVWFFHEGSSCFVFDEGGHEYTLTYEAR